MAEHFGQWEWASLAWRRLASGSAEAEGAMRAHLDCGCEVCAREYDFWRSLADKLRQDKLRQDAAAPGRASSGSTAIPAGTMSSVRRSFEENFRAGDGTGNLGVKLVFDSFAASRPASVRGSVAQAGAPAVIPNPQAARPSRRHCIYTLGLAQGEEADSRDRAASGEAGPDGASLEVMCERAGRYDRWSVVGQLLTAEGEGWLDCLLELSGGQEANSTGPRLARTNGMGEFCFTGVGRGPWCLDIQAGQRRWGVAPLLLP